MLCIRMEVEISMLGSRRSFLVPAPASPHFRSFGTKRTGPTCSLKR